MRTGWRDGRTVCSVCSAGLRSFIFHEPMFSGVFLSLNISGNINVSLCEWLTELELTVNPSQTALFLFETVSVWHRLWLKLIALCISRWFWAAVIALVLFECHLLEKASDIDRRLICILTGIQYKPTCHSSSRVSVFTVTWSLDVSRAKNAFVQMTSVSCLSANPSSMFKVPQHSILSRMFCSICKAEALCRKEDETSNAVLWIEIEFYTRAIGTAMTSLLIV